MTKEDIKARCVYISQKKKEITKNRDSHEILLRDANARKGQAVSDIKQAQNSINKSINLLCEFEGEKKGLLSLVNEEERNEIIDELKKYAIW